MIFDKKANQKERNWFIDYWAEFVRTHSDKEWSSQQKVFINPILKSARQLKREEYLALKEEKFSI